MRSPEAIAPPWVALKPFARVNAAEAKGIARGCGKDAVRVVAAERELIYARTGDGEIAAGSQLGEQGDDAWTAREAKTDLIGTGSGIGLGNGIPQAACPAVVGVDHGEDTARGGGREGCIGKDLEGNGLSGSVRSRRVAGSIGAQKEVYPGRT